MPTLVTRNVVVDGHRTSIRLEPGLWDALQEIAAEEHCSVHDICTEIARRGHATSFTSAVRSFILTYFRTLAHSNLPSVVGRPARPSALRHPKIERSGWIEQDGDFDRRTIWTSEALRESPARGCCATFWHWDTRRRALGRLPTCEELADGPIGAEMRAGNLSLIDVTSDDPHDFVVRQVSLLSKNGPFRIDPPQPIGRLPFALHAQALVVGVDEIKTRRQAQAASISQPHGGLKRGFLRIALPLGDGKGRVETIVTVIRGQRTKPSAIGVSAQPSPSCRCASERAKRPPDWTEVSAWEETAKWTSIWTSATTAMSAAWM